MLDRRSACVAFVLAVLSACDGAPAPTDDSGTTMMDSGGPPPAGCLVDEDCDDALYCNGAERCMPRATDSDGRGCVDAVSGPCAEGETCDEATNTCDAGCADADGDGHRDEACGGRDCDDADADRYPGNVEICDMTGHDEDCDTDTFGFVDADGDGSGSYVCCNVLAGGDLNCGDDCNDSDTTVNPRAGDGPPLYCDGIDNDCSSVADEGCPCVEGDTQECGTEAQRMRIGVCRPGTQVCSGGEYTATCIGATAPGEEICDGLDNDCDGTPDEAVLRTYYPDVDGDGYGATGGTPAEACSAPAGYASNATDCDDSVASINPGATEVCNAIDDNCLAGVDEGFVGTFYLDSDHDGFGDASTSTTGCSPPAGYVRNSDDCDDTRAIANPAGIEVCNGLDDNCAGGIDEGVLHTFYLDSDSDGAGGTTTTSGCTAPAMYVAVGGDCADTDASRYPGRFDACNGIDDDCNGAIDPGCTCTDGARRDCGVGPGGGAPTNVGECAIGSQLCVGGTWGSCVGDVGPTTETCDGLDQDCDGAVDDGTAIDNCLADGDGDGYGAGAPTRQCRDAARASAGYCPPGWTTTGGDCNDANGSVRPMGVEACNGIDDNCSGVIDEGVTATNCFADADADTYGIGSATTQCHDAARMAHGYCPTGYTNRGGDCNDASSAMRPGATESCNGRDDDCSGMADDGAGMICVAGTTRTGTGSNPFCASVPGTYACVSCTSETFTPSPPAETCNGTDDDCDGAPDDAFACVRGSTGHACVTGCGTTGTRTCSTSCSFTGQACTGTEVCNGCDDDGDGTADDGFACVAGSTRSGQPHSCGGTGTQRCLADCSGWSAATRAETCNGCDDDGDGVADNNFTCAQNSVRYCTTSCNTPGQIACNDTCSGYVDAVCHAASETCNYCDDDGNPLTSDASLANGIIETLLGCGYRAVSTVTTCSMPGSSTVRLVGGAANDVGAYWNDTTAAMPYMGWGPLTFVADVGASRSGTPSTYPADGWAVLLTQGGSGDLGAIGGGLGVPLTREGLAFEWRYYAGGSLTNQSDEITVARLSGGTRTVLATALAPVGMQLNSTSGTLVVSQRLYIEYTPDDPRTVASEEHLRVRFDPSGVPAIDIAAPASGGSGSICSDPCTSTSLSNELTPGQQFAWGFTASTGGSVSQATVNLNDELIFGGPYSRLQRSNVCF